MGFHIPWFELAGARKNKPESFPAHGHSYRQGKSGQGRAKIRMEGEI